MYSLRITNTYLRGRFDKSSIPSIPTCSVQEKPVYVYSFCGWTCNVFLQVPGDVIGENNTVQRPTFVRPSDLLTHSGEETLK